MVPPPMKAMPDKLYKPGLASARAPSAKQTARPSKLEPLRATEAVRGPPSSNSSDGSNMEDLNTAYTQYLQQLVLNKVTREMADFYSAREANKCAEVGVDVEVVTTGTTTIASNAPLALLAMKLEYLMKTGTFVKIYSELATIFEDPKSSTLGELQRALEAKFNGISLKDIDCSRPIQGEEDSVDLDNLMSRVKEHLAPQLKPTDVKSFLAVFIDSLKELLSSCTTAEEESTAASAASEALMDFNSMSVSAKLVSHKKQKKAKKNQS